MLRVETLEGRRLLSADLMQHHAVQVTESQIITHHDTIPRFGANPTNIAVANGLWSNSTTWSENRVPHADEITSIPHGVEVIYNIDSNVRLDVIEVSGQLEFDQSVDTSLWLNELIVMPSGTLTIGTAESPIAGSVTAEIVFTDTPGSEGHHFKTGSITAPGIDPSQYGNGLIVLGTLNVVGSDKTDFVRAVGDIRGGGVIVNLDGTPVGWLAEDLIVVPETSQTVIRKTPVILNETETSRIVNVSGSELTLSTPLKHNHFGITENSFGIERSAHVANLTRNVVLRSENPDGVRGHVQATGNATFNIANAEFRSLGRTSADSQVADTLFETDGSVFVIGENQVGRYPIHLHHLSNPFLIEGVVINDGLKWGIAIHDTNNGLLQNSIVYDVDGAGVVTENGNEVDNRFINNLVMKVDGGHQAFDARAGAVEARDLQGNRFIEIGADGSGFWLRASAGTFIGNTVYDSASYGFNFNGYYRTADSEFEFRQLDEFSNNETVSSKGGLWFTWSQGQSQIQNYQRQTVSDFLAWHVSHEGVKAYHEANLTFTGVTVIGNSQVSNRNEGSNTIFDARSTTGLWFGSPSYENHNLRLENIQVEGVNTGIVVPLKSGIEGTQIIGAKLRNYINIAMPKDSDAIKVRYENIDFLPSYVGRIANSFPEQVANVWHAETGVILPGSTSSDAPPGVPSNLPLTTQYRESDGRLILRGGDGDESVEVYEADGTVEFRFDGAHAFSIPSNAISIVIFWGAGGNDAFVNNSQVKLMAFGGGGNDRLVGGSRADSLFGEAGDDRIEGRGGDDRLYGGSGNDVILGGEGADKLRGESGNDQIWGGLGSDPIIDGGDGNDELFGDQGDDVIVGGSGNDFGSGGDGDDFVGGGDGHDQLFGGLGNDVLSGGSGNDWLQGDNGHDKLWGGDDDDTLVADPSDWVINGGLGHTTLF
ncbi:G8 domain-containing protein [Novipirellula herctigrandis]